jgi:uncharacterized membrane protein
VARGRAEPPAGPASSEPDGAGEVPPAASARIDVMTSRWKRSSPWLLAGLLAGAGVTHFAIPRPYARIVPKALPEPELLVAASGVAELACAALVAHPRTRRWGAWTAAALFVAVFPANVQMALDSARGPAWYRAGAWARLPLQAPLVWWAVRVGQTSRGRRVDAR